LAVAALLIVIDAALSLMLGLHLHRQIAVVTVRLVVQLLLIGYVLRSVFALGSPAVTLLIVLLMAMVASREMGARPERRLARFGNYAIAGAVVTAATGVTAALALTTAIQPHPWWNPHYAIPLAGINAGPAVHPSKRNGCAHVPAGTSRRVGSGARTDRTFPMTDTSLPQRDIDLTKAKQPPEAAGVPNVFWPAPFEHRDLERCAFP
jgi:putative ABC transport system permease protein